MEDPNQAISIKTTSSQTDPWQALQLFNLYRLAIALSLMGIGRLNHYYQVLILTEESLYLSTSLVYLGFSACWLTLSLILKRNYPLQTNVPLFTDIVFLILLMTASGGILSGIGLLLIVTVAAHALLMPGKLSLFSAALATIGLILSQLYQTWTLRMPLSLFTPVGVMGLVIFATTIITYLLGKKIRAKENEVRQKEAQLSVSQQLNTHIIFALESGILVLDPKQKVQLINTAAKSLLGVEENRASHTIIALPAPLQKAFTQWQTYQNENNTAFISPTGRRVRCQFLPLGKVFSMGTLIFITDADKESERVQELKLASLGHLTANIAHELRNPLSAISQSAQLLNESTDLSSNDKALIVLMKKNCNRINQVIQNVLSLSTNKKQRLEKIELMQWLNEYVVSFTAPQYPALHIDIQSTLSSCWVQVDTSQLTQILNNLSENGLRYSQQFTGKAAITLHLISLSEDRVALDVTNAGKTISVEQKKYLFEPFYTTESSGSGLGLYIAKALSEQNGLHLDYTTSKTTNQNQFRLIFPIGDPQHV